MAYILSQGVNKQKIIKDMKRNILLIVLTVLINSVVVLGIVKLNSGSKDRVSDTYVYSDESGTVRPVVQNVTISGDNPDFVYAAENSVNAVVYVKVVKRAEKSQTPPSIFDYFFGYGDGVPREMIGTGSGVIITEDGYVVTNNHVISGATEIDVTVADQKTFRAELVGTDPATDIALLKIDAKGLPTIPMGNSDNLRLGEWVLAIGSPYGLTSTITAGIVSAKGRTMQSNQREFKIESFIQTDAAVNPGNSGGALVNVKGELVGINTAIISQTGAYSGYSFAVPVNIVSRVVEDLKSFGSVKRAVLGITMTNNSEDLKEQMKLSSSKGVYITEVAKGGAAATAGVKDGDILESINSEKVKNSASVQEMVNRYRPGDVIELGIIRGEKSLKLKATLIAKETQEMNAYNINGTVNLLGATLATAPKEELENLDLKYGVKIIKLERGKVRDAGIKEGFIITYVNNNPVTSPQDVAAQVKKSRRSILIEGFYPDGRLYYYAVGL